MDHRKTLGLMLSLESMKLERLILDWEAGEYWEPARLSVLLLGPMVKLLP